MKSNKTGNEFHPTQKPVDLMSYLIEKSTNKGDVVLDPFAGSCSTLVAAQQVGRNYIGIELEGDYVKVCNERLLATNSSLF